jgi:tetratricopeptide (TPR) repeat protein
MNRQKLVSLIFIVVLSGCGPNDVGHITKSEPSIHYPKSEMMEALKAELDNVNIVYRTYHRDDDKEFISWAEKYDSQVTELKLKVTGATPPKGRSASYKPQIHNERLKQKLQKAKVPFTTTLYLGNEYIIWPDEHQETVAKVINRVYSDDLYGEAKLYMDLGEYEKGIKLLKEAASTGNTEAQVHLGNELIRGKHIDRDFNKAVEFYTRAANQNDTGAYVSLGLAYYGRTKSQDDVKALYWFKKAAENNEELGMWMIGQFYKEGRGGLEINLSDSEIWYGKAKALGADFSFLVN